MEHKAALFMVVLLFALQAVCDLALPLCTSRIVDVGIQQSGIADCAPEYLSSNTYGLLLADLEASGEGTAPAATSAASASDGSVAQAGTSDAAPADELSPAELFAACYEPADPAVVVEYVIPIDGGPAPPVIAYQLADIDSETRAVLSDNLAYPLVEVFYGTEVADAAAAQGGKSLSQQAVAAIQEEYADLNVNVSSMQMHYLWTVGGIMMALALAALILHCSMNFFACRTASKIGRDLRARFFRNVVAFSDSEVGRFSAASLITRGTNDVQLIQNMCLMLQRMAVYSPLVAIGGIIMVARTNVSMWWTIALAVALVIVCAILLIAITMPKFRIMQKLIDRVNLVSREILNGLPVIRAFGRESFEDARFQRANEDLLRTQLFTNRAMSFMGPILMLIMNGVAVLIVWIGGQYVDLGTMQTGDLIAFITYSMVVISSFLFIGVIAVMLPRANVAAARIDEVIEAVPAIRDADAVRDSELFARCEKTASPDSAAGEVASPEPLPGVGIEFRDVCFRYDDDSQNVLDHVSFTIEPGQTVAIIGSTGCGKTTVIKLIERFHDVTSGAVLIDGIDVRELSQAALHRTFGYVPQQAFLFSGTVASNVGYGSHEGEMPQGRIDTALEIAQAADFVRNAEEGLDLEITQGGTNVSGGQRQRLAIARALAVDARGYLFDDSFSALDYRTDKQLRQELAARLAGRTVLIVAQRIATIMHADSIIVLDDGCVVGRGTHEELLATCAEYREIAQSQLSDEELSLADASASAGVQPDAPAAPMPAEPAPAEPTPAEGGDA